MTSFENVSSVSNLTEASEDIALDSGVSLENRLEIDRQAQVGFDPEALIPKQTYVEAGIEKITALANALGMSEKTSEIIEVFRVMASSWRDKKVGAVSDWCCDVSDDGSPFEFSIAFKEDRAELRILLEAQGENPDLQSNWQAGLDLNQYLAKNFGINLDRFDLIKDLFIPNNSDAKLAMWHAVCFSPDKEPTFKLYLNPQSQGANKAAAVVEESFVRLGFTHAWMGLAETAAQRGPDKDDFIYFSLDLAKHERARVKVYLRHFEATPEDLEGAMSLSQNYIAGQATVFCQALAPEYSSFSCKPATTCFSWIEGDDLTPSNATLYLPIGHYVTNDRMVRDRLDIYFSQSSFPVTTYYAAIQAWATRPLEAGIGMHSYVAFSPEAENARIMVYLNPELNEVKPPFTALNIQSIRSLPSLEEVVWYYEDRTLAYHPFFQRLQREPVNLQAIWLLLMNLREATTNNTRRLASILSRVEDERIRCILAKQLNDELGNGNIKHIHRKSFEQMMTVLEHWKMESFTEDMVISGKEFSQQLENIYVNSNPYVSVGSTILMEVYGKQFYLWLGQELRKTNVDLSRIPWVTLHEELEVDHANESLILAGFVTDSKEGVIAARQGIEKSSMASWKFLDSLYCLCYG